MTPKSVNTSSHSISDFFYLAITERAQALVFTPFECLVQVKDVLCPIEGLSAEHIPGLIAALKGTFQIQEKEEGVTQQVVQVSLLLGEKILPARVVRIPPIGVTGENIIVFVE